MAKPIADQPVLIEDRTESLVDWGRSHSRQLGIAAIALVALGAIGWIWRTGQEKKEANASRSLGEAQQSFTAGNLALAQSDLQRLIQRYNGTTAEIQGRMMLAQVLFDQGKADSGIAVLRAAGSPGAFAAAYHSVLAAGLEQGGKPAEAAAEYLRASDAAVSAAERSSLRADAARAYRTAGNTAEATRIWTELAADETNPISAEAKLRLGELSAKPMVKG